MWDVLEPLFQSVVSTGEAFWAKDHLFGLERHGYVEETYFDVSYDPVRDETGRVGGLFCIVSETTGRIIGERRLGALRDLGRVGNGASSAGEVFRNAAAVLERYQQGRSFRRALQLGRAGGLGTPRGNNGARAGRSGAPERIDRANRGDSWPVGGESEMVLAEPPRGMTLPGGPWPEAAKQAAVLKIATPGQEPYGYLVAGISPRRRFDDDYADFFRLAGRQHRQRHRRRPGAGGRAQACRGARRARPGENRFLQQCEPRVPHAAHIDARPAGGPSGEDRRRHAAGEPGAAHGGAAKRPAAAQARQYAARLRAHRSRARAGLLSAHRPCRADGGPGEQFPLGLRARRHPSRGRLPAAAGGGLRRSGDVGKDRSQPAFQCLQVHSRGRDFRADAGCRSQSWSWWCSDTGTGIPAESLPRMFERFHRVEDARGRSHEGSGIGLALVNELVKLHGGSIAVQSKLGEGTTFTVAIPKGSAHLPAERVKAPREAASSTASRAGAYVAEALGWLPETQTAPAPARPHGTQRILLADDNADLREYVRRLLAEHYDVHAVADGRAAIEAARARRPDLIISDVMMPRLDGFGLIRELRADPELRAIPVILLSARAGEEARVEGLGSGADDYLVKPFSSRELLVRVGTLMKSAEMHRRANEALAQFETLLNEAPLGVYLVDDEFRIAAVNPVALPVFGDIPDLIGRDFDEVIHVLWPKAYADEIVQLFRHTLETGEPHIVPERIEERLDRRVTEFYEWQINRIPLPGSRQGVVCYFRDISKSVMAREALREADSRKDEFLATLSHELRNPLAPLRSSLEVLKLAGTQGRARRRGAGNHGASVEPPRAAGRRSDGSVAHHSRQRRTAQGAGEAGCRAAQCGGGQRAPDPRRKSPSERFDAAGSHRARGGSGAPRADIRQPSQQRREVFRERRRDYRRSAARIARGRRGHQRHGGWHRAGAAAAALQDFRARKPKRQAQPERARYRPRARAPVGRDARRTGRRRKRRPGKRQPLHRSPAFERRAAGRSRPRSNRATPLSRP